MSIRTEIGDDELRSLRQQIEPLAKGFDALTDHVVVSDIHGNIIYANQAAEEATGFSRAEMLGKNPGDLWGGNMPNEIYKDMWNTIKVLKKSWHGRVRNRRKDGFEYDVWLRVNPIMDADDNIRFFVAVEPFLDSFSLSEEEIRKAITAKINLYDFYRGKVLKAEDLDRLIDKFMAELKEPKREI